MENMSKKGSIGMSIEGFGKIEFSGAGLVNIEEKNSKKTVTLRLLGFYHPIDKIYICLCIETSHACKGTSIEEAISQLQEEILQFVEQHVEDKQFFDNILEHADKGIFKNFIPAFEAGNAFMNFFNNKDNVKTNRPILHREEKYTDRSQIRAQENFLRV